MCIEGVLIAISSLLLCRRVQSVQSRPPSPLYGAVRLRFDAELDREAAGMYDYEVTGADF